MLVQSTLVKSKHLKSNGGSILTIALITCSILATIGASSFMVLQNRFRLTHQTGRWQEALLPAEAGVDLAINEIRKQLYRSDLSSDYFSSSVDLNGDGIVDGGWQAGE